MIEFKQIPFAELVGYKIEFCPTTLQASCVLSADDVHLNNSGVVHGGVLATLLDSTSGLAASLSFDASATTPVVTVSLNINYLLSVYPGLIEATAKVKRSGRSLAFVEAQIFDKERRIVATATGVFKKRRT